MLRENLRKELKDLEKELVKMGEMTITAIERSVEALKSRDVDEAKRIISDDVLINKKRWEIEERCVNLIATQQPVATDLREIIALLNIISDLERIGDNAAGIARIVIQIGDEPLLKPLIDIPRMMEKATDMIRRSITAFLRRDAEAARAICKEDDEVDALYHQVYRELLSFMIEDPRTITRATHLMRAARKLERIADRATNICERTVFLVTGEMWETDSPNS